MGDYKDLVIWRKAMEVVREVYVLSGNFPKEELYGLTSQIRRSAISIPSNIAEGAARASRNEFMPFLSIARGSAAELETQLMLAEQLGFCQENQAIFEKIISIRQMINALRRSLREKR